MQLMVHVLVESFRNLRHSFVKHIALTKMMWIAVMEVVILDACVLVTGTVVPAVETTISSSLAAVTSVRFGIGSGAPNNTPNKQQQPKEWGTVCPQLTCSLSQHGSVVDDEADKSVPPCCDIANDDCDISDHKEHHEATKEHD